MSANAMVTARNTERNDMRSNPLRVVGLGTALEAFLRMQDKQCQLYQADRTIHIKPMRTGKHLSEE
jgi:hypothetical protein